MSQSSTSPFNILPSAPPNTVVDEEYRKASVQVLADGSQAVDGVVQLKIFDRDIWYDIENHIVQKWTGSEDAGIQPTLPSAASATSCAGCSCGHGAEAATPQDEEAKYQKQQATTRKLYDVHEETEVNTIELHVNDKCNFRCNYCYLKSANIEYHDNEMPREVAKKSVDFLLNGLKPGGTGVIKFYGGEPFLSYGLMKYVVQHARETAAAQRKRVVFTVTTNGTLLNPERIAWCKENNVRVTISLDGNEASNDKHRVYESGNGTHKVVAKKAKQFLEEAGYLNLRATINDGSFELKDSMLEFLRVT
jgi:sulfatase maturation enzyme AslB (radical SAM superfamily)